MAVIVTLLLLLALVPACVQPFFWKPVTYYYHSCNKSAAVIQPYSEQISQISLSYHNILCHDIIMERIIDRKTLFFFSEIRFSLFSQRQHAVFLYILTVRAVLYRFFTRRHPAHPVSVPTLHPREMQGLRSQNCDFRDST